MSAKPRAKFEFDPYKRPPAARLLAVLVVGILIAWTLSASDRSQLTQFHRDPAKLTAHIVEMAHKGFEYDAVMGLVIVSVVVFAVDGLTSLFGRWLTEREQAGGAAPPSSARRADALLGPSDLPSSEN